MNPNIEELRKWCLVKAFMDAPFYGIMAASFPVVIRPLPKHIYGATNGSIIVLNQDCEKITRDNIMGLLAHEINHIIMHHTRPTVTVQHPEVWRMAQEIEAEMFVPRTFGSINDDLTKQAREFRLKGLDTLEKIYLHLLEHPEEQHVPMVDLVIFCGGQAGGDDSDLQVKSALSGAQVPVDAIVSKVLQAVTLAQSIGSVPMDLLQKIDGLRKPRINWRSFLRQFWGTKVGIHDLKVDRINQLYWSALRIAVPPIMDTHGSPDVVLAIDTSASMTGKPITLGVSEIRGLAGLTSDVDVYIADAEVHAVVNLRDVSDQEILDLRENLRGGGGTSFVPVFEAVEKRRDKPQLLVYITDTWGEFPDKWPDYPVIWLVPGTQERPSVPFGQVVLIPPEEYA